MVQSVLWFGPISNYIVPVPFGYPYDQQSKILMSKTCQRKVTSKKRKREAAGKKKHEERKKAEKEDECVAAFNAIH